MLKCAAPRTACLSLSLPLRARDPSDCGPISDLHPHFELIWRPLSGAALRDWRWQRRRRVRVPPLLVFGDARAGEENGVRASAAALGGHECTTGDKRAPPDQRGGGGCPSPSYSHQAYDRQTRWWRSSTCKIERKSNWDGGSRCVFPSSFCFAFNRLCIDPNQPFSSHKVLNFESFFNIQQ
jgi:hypothetical protein